MSIRHAQLTSTDPLWLARSLRWKHGRNCYANHGCRCETCMKGHREFHLDYYRKKVVAARRDAPTE